MTMQAESADLDPDKLAAELLGLRRYGVRRGFEKVPTPTLEAAARRLNDDPGKPVIEQVIVALNLAAEHLGQEDRGPAIATIMDFGPRKPNQRYLKNRRAEAAKQLGEEVKTLENTLEKEMLKNLAGHLVRLAEEHAPSVNQPERVSKQLSTPPPDEQADGAIPKLATTAIATRAAVKMMTDEMEEVLYEGLAQAVSANTVPLLVRLAEAVISDVNMPAQQTRQLLVQVISEVEQDIVVQVGLAELLELSGATHYSLNERRQRSRRNLFYIEDQIHDSRFKPHRQKEREERICKRLAKPLAELATQHGIIQ